MENLRAAKNKTKKVITKRPKSSVLWDPSINSFLRPYTAKLKKNKQNILP